MNRILERGTALAALLATLLLSACSESGSEDPRRAAYRDAALNDAEAQRGQAFLAQNRQREEVRETASGLQYEVLRPGGGAKPAIDQRVRVHYKGTLVDGTVFDSSYERRQPATFPLRGVIAGWTEALQLMPVGSAWRIYLPPQLAYGARSPSAKIPPNATLIFDVELLEIEAP